MMNTQAAPAWLPSALVPFFTLSYPTAPPPAPDSFHDSSYYNTGLLDGCLIITFIAVMAILRDVVRLYALEPFARWKLTRDLRYRHAILAANGNGFANGDEKGNGHSTCAKDFRLTEKEQKTMHRSVVRFAEQGWFAIYYTYSWVLGLYIHHNLPTKVLDPVDVWLNYPHIPLAGPVKFYYLLETAFYIHGVLVINAEERRKDHWQMMTHHVITIALMIGSYAYHFTRVGCLIMILMDYCDIWLPVAKMFRYLSFATLCDVTFVWFLLSWAVTRHWLFILVIKSTWDARNIVTALKEDAETYRSYLLFFFLLVMLQIIQIMWFAAIVRVAWLVVSGQGADDTRSEGGDDEDVSDDEDRKSR